MEAQKKIAVVILNYNGIHWLKKFLGEVVIKSPEAEIWVADNSSTDNSISYLQKNHPSVKIIQNKKNEGFAGGYNQALKDICAHYYILLNTDIEVTKNWLNPLIERMEKDATIAACQPKIRSFHEKEYFEYAGAAGGFLDRFGYPFCRGRVLNTLEKDNGQYDIAMPIFWATGACLCIRSKAFHDLGGFDADFFAHQEEIDLCWRLQNKGHGVWVEPKSMVYHVGGGTLNSDHSFKTYLNFRNNLFMLYKNLKNPWRKICIRLILDGIAGLHFLTKGKFKHCGAIVKAHFAFYAAINHLKSKRANTFDAKLFPKAILWEYFLKKKKKFSELTK